MSTKTKASSKNIKASAKTSTKKIVAKKAVAKKVASKPVAKAKPAKKSTAKAKPVAKNNGEQCYKYFFHFYNLRVKF